MFNSQQWWGNRGVLHQVGDTAGITPGEDGIKSMVRSEKKKTIIRNYWFAALTGVKEDELKKAKGRYTVLGRTGVNLETETSCSNDTNACWIEIPCEQRKVNPLGESRNHTPEWKTKRREMKCARGGRGFSLQIQGLLSRVNPRGQREGAYC